MDRSKPIKRISDRQKRINERWNKLVSHLIEYRAKGLCEICHNKPDWRGLQGHHIVKRSQGGPYNAGNCIIACGLCHDHSKYGTGLPITYQEALDIVNRQNQKYGINPEEIWC